MNESAANSYLNHPDDEAISLMMLERLTGRISPEDEQVLQQLIATNADIRDEWAERAANYRLANAENIQGEFNDGSLKMNAHERLAQLEARVRRMHLWRNVAAAAVLAGLLAGGAWLWWGKKGGDEIAGNDAALPIKKGLKLELYNGSTIDLSTEDNANHVSTNGVEFDNNTAARKLSYKAGKNTAGKSNTLAVPAGMDYRLALSDGSEVFLNSASSVVFPFSFQGQTREITIKGEAYFKIASNPGHPFIVHLPHADIQVLGTEFNVNAYDSTNIKVSLHSGAIRLIAFDKDVQVKPGSQVQLNSMLHALEVKKFTPEELSWVEGKYVLDNTPLSELSAVIPRWFGVSVVLDNEQLGNRHFSGIIYKNQPVEHFLDRLAAATGCSYYFKNGVLHIQ